MNKGLKGLEQHNELITEVSFLGELSFNYMKLFLIELLFSN